MSGLDLINTYSSDSNDDEEIQQIQKIEKMYSHFVMILAHNQ